MKFSIYQESQTGARPYNQDRVGYVFSRDALFMIVADGMGGHAQCEVAAQITVETIGKRFQRYVYPSWIQYLSDSSTNRCFCRITDGSIKERNHFITAKFIHRCSWSECITQKCKTVFGMIFISLIILTIHYFSLFRVQGK